MPGCAVDPDSAVDVPHHHPVVAQHAHTWCAHPLPRHRRLAGAGVTREEVRPAVAIDDRTGVNLDAASKRQPIGQQQLVQRVVERIALHARRETGTMEVDDSTGKIRGHRRRLVRKRAELRRRQSKDQPLAVAIELPHAARVELQRAWARRGRRPPPDVEVDVGRSDLVDELGSRSGGAEIDLGLAGSDRRRDTGNRHAEFVATPCDPLVTRHAINSRAASRRQRAARRR